MKAKQILGLFLVLMLALICLVSCGNEDGSTTPEETTAPDDGKLEYTVTVVDYKGNPPTEDVLIELYKDGNFVGGMRADAEGKMSTRLEKGSYTFVPSPAEGAFYYDEAACVLTEDSPNATVTLYRMPGEKREIYPFFADLNERAKYDAVSVGEGATYVEIDRPEMSYYIFTPTRGGVYRFSYISESALTIGYFGDANVVLTASTIEVKDGAFELEIKNGSIGTDGGGTLSMVIGLRSLAVKNCILVIERIGDPAEEMQWTDIAAEDLPESFDKVDYLNHSLVDISVTDPSVKLVYNESDGLYHYGSATGPVVYVRISSASPYLASFRTICDTTRMCNYFFDEDGTLLKKESYNNLILAYAEIANSFGIVPLNDELIYVIKNTGEYMKWWDFTAGGNNIFTSNAEGEENGMVTSSIIKENAWMFACCYIEEYTSGSADAPILMTVSDDLTQYVLAKKNEALTFKANNMATLTVTDARGLTVSYGGESYTADEQGVITVVMEEASYSFTMTYTGSEDVKEIAFTFAEYIPTT